MKAPQLLLYVVDGMGEFRNGCVKSGPMLNCRVTGELSKVVIMARMAPRRTSKSLMCFWCQATCIDQITSSDECLVAGTIPV